MIDAHCHTDCSDGAISIEERVDLAYEVGMEAVTITDHDFISETQVMRAVDRAYRYGMPYIPGIELTLIHKKRIVHVLGYFVNPNDAFLQRHIDEVQHWDIECTAKLMVEARNYGVDLELEDLKSASLHTFYSLQFVKYISKNLFANDATKTLEFFVHLMRRAHIRYSDFAPFDIKHGVNLLHDAGAIAVVAHPGGVQDMFMRKLGFVCADMKTLQEFINLGIDGVEVYTPVHTRQEREFYKYQAEKFGLLTTGGSDCHGDDLLLGPRRMGRFTDLPLDGFERLIATFEAVHGKMPHQPFLYSPSSHHPDLAKRLGT
ncbi:PHP domain-containing protein [Candidatus Hadarchaeum sp.]|uniref:PHP domain-containing protein n=1 Tax=Candidatus Hadarchaeum sp. TaxID=2883567 RepID=UPI00319D9BC9